MVLSKTAKVMSEKGYQYCIHCGAWRKPCRGCFHCPHCGYATWKYFPAKLEEKNK